MPGAHEYATHQASEYRRGFVLGLTLAEAILLLLFVILLLLLLGFERRENEIERLLDAERRLAAISADRSESDVTELLEKAEILADIEERSGVEISNDFLELVQDMQAQSESGTVNVIERLEEQRKLLDDLQQQLEDYSALGPPSELKRRLELAEADESTLRGHVAELQRRLEAAGNGRVLPSCWSTERGEIQYLLDITLLDEGLLVQETIPTGRQLDRGRIPLSGRNLADPLSVGQFLSWTRDLFEYSVANECRFYVRVHDETGSSMKQRFKELLLAVENHFYKLLLG